MTEPFDWTADAESTADPFDQVAYVEAPLDPYFVADDPFAPALDETGQYVVDEPVLDWVEVSTDATVDVSYDWSAGSDWLVIDPTVPLDPGYAVLDDGFAYTYTDTGWIDLGTGSCECMDIGLSAVDAPTGWDAAPIALEVPQPADDAVYQSPQSETTPVVAFDPGFLAEPIVESIEPANTIVVGGTDFFGQTTAEDVATIDMGGIGTFDGLGTGDPNSSATIVIGGTDFFGGRPAEDVATIDMGGIGTFDGLGTGDPNSGATIIIGGTDIFGSAPGGGVTTIDIGGIGTFDGLGTGEPNSSGTILIGGNDFDFGSGPSWSDSYLEMVRLGDEMRQRSQATIDELMATNTDPTVWSMLFNLQKSADDQIRLGLLPSYQSERDAGLVYSLDEYQRRWNLSFMPMP